MVIKHFHLSTLLAADQFHYFLSDSKSCCMRKPSVKKKMAIFLLQDTLSAWMNLGKHSLFVRLFVSSVKRGTRRVIRPDELSSVVRRSSAQQKIARLDG